MAILDRYVLKSFLKSFIGAVILLTGIGLIAKVNETLKNFIGIEDKGFMIIQYYLLSIPTFVTFIVPPALMFSVAYTIAMFKKNNEISVILAAGRPFKRILKPISIFSSILVVIFFLFNEFISYPFAYKAYDVRDVIRDYENRREVWVNQNISFRFENRFYTIGSLDFTNNRINSLHYVQFGESDFPAKIVESSSAEYHLKEKLWHLTEGSVTEMDVNGAVKNKLLFKKLSYKLSEDFTTLSSVHNRNTGADERNIFLIQELMNAQKKTGGDYHYLETEFYWHLGYPLICFFVTYIGGHLGSRMKTGGVAVSIALAMVFTIFYFFLMYFGTALGETGVLSPFFAANLANFVSLGVAVYIKLKFDW